MKRILIYMTALMICLAGNAFAGERPHVDKPISETVHLTTVRTVNGAVVVENASGHDVEVMVFAITGSLVKKEFLVHGETLTIELPAGYYIVKAGDTSKRVAVK